MRIHRLSSSYKLLVVAGTFAWLLAPSGGPVARGGVVNFVSFQEFVVVRAPGLDNSATPREQRQDGANPGFNGNVSLANALGGTLVTSTQTSSADLTSDGGATFAARGSTVVSDITASAGGESFFKAVFDVTAPAHFAISYSQSNSARFPASTATFDGPSGLGAIPLGLPAGFGNDMLPGRYTLTADTNSGSSFDLQLVVTPAASAVPLPAQAWSGLSLMALLIMFQALRTRAYRAG